MAVQITIIGTGQVGTSMGLALAEHQELFFRLGHDKDIRIANRAKALGAFDRVEGNLPSSVSDAAIVILAIPLDQIQETLRLIAPNLKEDAVIMETAPVKREVLQWASEYLPPRRYYIGLVPALNPAYLRTLETGVEAARADLFKNGTIAILSPQDTPSEALKLAVDFSHLLGAGHMFIDPTELDSMMAATYLLPQLMGAALLNLTVGKPGWYDARKLADRPFTSVSGPAAELGDENSQSSGMISAHQHLERLIDGLVENLLALRQHLSSQASEQLANELGRARQGRQSWLGERAAGHWGAAENASNVQLPTFGQEFKRMFTFGAGRKPKQKN